LPIVWVTYKQFDLSAYRHNSRAGDALPRGDEFLQMIRFFLRPTGIYVGSSLGGGAMNDLAYCSFMYVEVSLFV
jgi:hypothetical protein